MRKTRTVAPRRVDAAAIQHTIPAIDRMMSVLSALEEQPRRRLDNGTDGRFGAAPQHGLSHPQHAGGP